MCQLLCLQTNEITVIICLQQSDDTAFLAQQLQF